MANIFAILRAPSFDSLCAMTLGDLARWHERAVARAPKEK